MYLQILSITWQAASSSESSEAERNEIIRRMFNLVAELIASENEDERADSLVAFADGNHKRADSLVAFADGNLVGSEDEDHHRFSVVWWVFVAQNVNSKEDRQWIVVLDSGCGVSYIT